MNRLSIALTTIVLLFAANLIYASVKKPSFNEYINQIRKQALKAGVSEKTLNKYLTNIPPPEEPKTSVYVKEQTHQAAKVDTFEVYKKQFIPEKNLVYAREQYKKNLPLLRKIEKKYHVQPRFLVALWGIESDYGRDTGHFPLVRSMAILGYHHHRSKFFRQQFVDTLIMLDRPKVIPEQLKSAWDGGMGQCQFEPGTYLSFGVDFDKNGFADIWTSLPDVFASIANFLHQNGWNGNETWGIPITVPKNFPIYRSGKKHYRALSYWRQLGVKQRDGKSLPKVNRKGAILLPDGINGEAFLVYPNFKVLLRWNDIIFEGLAVGILSNAIVEPNKKQEQKQ